MSGRLQARLLCGAAVIGLMGAAQAAQAAEANFSIPAQSLASALSSFSEQSGRPVLYRPEIATQKVSPGAAGEVEAEVALNQLLAGTGLTWKQDGDTFLIMRTDADPQSGSAAGDGADGTVEALIVTAQKREEDIQDVPIAISAFTQDDLTRSQVAGGPDLMTQVPNFTFTKTNFSSYSIQIRGIGTQAISATTDPAVAIAFNNTPFVRNRFFEQEFYDLQRVEVLRGPQGTLYGRNATAGVVNIISAKPSFGYEAKLSADIANYSSTRVEGMINMPIVEDRVALRLAGAWTKREGYSTNQLTGNPIDGRDLWSTRLSLRFAPTDRLDANLVWEHFEEDDDRLRSGKQLCKKDLGPDFINGVPVPKDFGGTFGASAYYSQGCKPVSLYSPEAFQTPNGFALPYYGPLGNLGAPVDQNVDPYVTATQSTDLRVIESTRDPEYRANSDLVELQVSFELTPELTLSSETAYSADELFSTQDFNRFNTKPGAFTTLDPFGEPTQDVLRGLLSPEGVFCDPQLGCSDRLVAADLSTAKSRQFSQEFRLSSDFDGPFNFSLGTNFLRYDTEDKYYVFINSLSLFAAQAWGSKADIPYVPGVTDNMDCLDNLMPGDPNIVNGITNCIYIDPNPIGSLNDLGHNYFLSKNPYRLISYAVFGETYYNVTDNLKVTAGLRWTVDKKHAPLIPSWLLAAHTFGYPVSTIVEQEWREPTGRLTVDWKPALTFTDETLLYGSYAHGYKAGGANPPPIAVATYGGFDQYNDLVLSKALSRVRTFDAEYVDAFEVGTKNTLLDGRVTLNLNAFYYDYRGYQISQIVDRTAVNMNFDAEVWGAEIELDWRPLENLRLGFKGGWENTRLADGSKAIDLMDRTAGKEGWVLKKPFPTVPSNCILPDWLVTWGGNLTGGVGPGIMGECVMAYYADLDPYTWLPYVKDPEVDRSGNPITDGYPGFNPDSAPNNGEGFDKDLSGNELPNAPDFTATITADYTLPLPNDWLMTLHTDLYYQSEAWTRVFNTEGYDKLKAYTNVNLAAIFTNEAAGWNVMAYVKNVFDRDSITGAFLNSDDVGLTTNVFLTEPRLYGLRVTKEWTGLPWLEGAKPRTDGEPYPFTVEVGGGASRLSGDSQLLRPAFVDEYESSLPFPLAPQDEDLDWGDSSELKLTFAFGKTWRASLGFRQGGANGNRGAFDQEAFDGGCFEFNGVTACIPGPEFPNPGKYNYGLTSVRDTEEHDIVDFVVGREMGMGSLDASSVISVGVRYADFRSTTEADLRGVPEYYMAPENALKYPIHHTQYAATLDADRSFKGAGPHVSWEMSKALLGDASSGFLNLDAGVGAGVLFGKQKAQVEIAYSATYHDTEGFAKYETPIEIPPISSSRSKSVSVPVLDLNLGLSYSLDRFKVGAGYRWERYYDAIDGGLGERQASDRTIDGPYMKFSLGFGG